MENVAVNTPVDVAVVFDRRRVRPRWFVWNGRKYAVQEITYTWRSRRGNADLLHFAVTDGATLFELSFDLKELSWRLERTSFE